MKKTGRLLMGLLLLAAALLSGCALDVVADGSAVSLERLAEAMPQGVTADEGGLRVGAPDDSATVLVKKDWSGDMDLLMEINAAPFLSAGLDEGKLPEGWALEGGKLRVGTDVGEGILDGETPLAIYQSLVSKAPGILGYHMEMGHFGIDLGGGMLEWAKDLQENDKDIVFVIDPAPLEEAGLDPAAVEGWTLAEVPTMDSYGAKITVTRLLKPFDLVPESAA